MTEQEAREWIEVHHGSNDLAILERLVELIVAEASVQNLVAPSTLTAMWVRHVVDSAQLLHLPDVASTLGTWIDVGSGAGFPGLVVACLTDRQVTLVEPRKRRAEFLERAVGALGLADRTTVVTGRIEALDTPGAIISARAVGFMGDLFDWATRCATRKTLWILPKGRGAREEVASAANAWHGMFHVERSVTDAESLIVLASKVTRR